MNEALFIQVRCRSGSLAEKTYTYLDPLPLSFPKPLQIGRSPDAHIGFLTANEQMVSRRHLELEVQGGKLLVRDVGSTQGTLEASTQARITQRVLSPGSSLEVQLGPGGPICHIGIGRALPFGRYLLTGRIGVGGMGEVYTGYDTQLGRYVVLKLLRDDCADSGPEAACHLLDEARIVAQLEHPNVVRVYDVGDADGIMYLAMEYLRGVSLRQILRASEGQGGRLPPKLAAAIVQKIYLGLHAAHEHLIQAVHRDISVNNILVTRDEVKLIDFGLARAQNRVGQSFSEGNKIAGCPPYMSPEQIRTPSNVDRRSDLFSAGVVLYELCTGHRPFQRDTVAATLHAVLFYDVPPLRSLCPEASEALEQIVQCALAKDPDERPASALEIAAALQAEIGSQYAKHEDLIFALKSLSIDLDGPPPELLAGEPELVQRARKKSRPPLLGTAPPPPVAPSVPLEVLLSRPLSDGRYRLVSELGAADENDVGGLWKRHYLAVQRTANGQEEQVALALCGGMHNQYALAETEAARFSQYVAQRCSQGAVRVLPPILDHREAWPQGPLYLVTPYYSLRLCDLDAVTMTVAQRLRLMIQILEGLRELGEKTPGFVHGDLRPENIGLVPRAGDSYAPVLLDFCPSAVLHVQSKLKGVATPSPYLAPECWEGTTPKPPADVFAIGMIFYWLFGGDVKVAQCSIKEDFELPSLSARAQHSVGTDVERVIFEALHIDPEMRPLLAEFLAVLTQAVLPSIGTSQSGQSGNSELELPLELKAAQRELRTPQFERIKLTVVPIDPQMVREPIPIPLDLSGLADGCRYPLQLLIAGRLLEFRVGSEALRTVRIYSDPRNVHSTAARNSLTLPNHNDTIPLYVGHHRGKLHLVHVTVRTTVSPGEVTPRISLPQLGLCAVAPLGGQTTVVFYRTEVQQSLAYLVCLVFK